MQKELSDQDIQRHITEHRKLFFNLAGESAHALAKLLITQGIDPAEFFQSIATELKKQKAIAEKLHAQAESNPQ